MAYCGPSPVAAGSGGGGGDLLHRLLHFLVGPMLVAPGSEKFRHPVCCAHPLH